MTKIKTLTLTVDLARCFLMGMRYQSRDCAMR
jgi:hypothetical protein